MIHSDSLSKTGLKRLRFVKFWLGGLADSNLVICLCVKSFLTGDFFDWIDICLCFAGQSVSDQFLVEDLSLAIVVFQNLLYWGLYLFEVSITEKEKAFNWFFFPIVLFRMLIILGFDFQYSVSGAWFSLSK